MRSHFLIFDDMNTLQSNIEFSIVIPTLNEELFLPNLLESLTQQTFKNFEVIIIDAHSTDQTVQKAKTFRRLLSHLTIITSRKRHVGYQRNLGASKSKGRYLIFFDADILIPTHFLEQLHSHILLHRYQLLTTYLVPPDQDLKKRVITTAANIGKELVTFIGKPTAGGYNIIVTKELFDSVGGFDLKVVYGEDYDFIQRCYKGGSILKILKKPQVIFSFRRYEKEGYLPVIEQFAVSTVHALIHGAIREPIFDYPMGGHIYRKDD